MAVRIDPSAFRESIPAAVAATADRLLREGGVSDLEAVGGGARAVVCDTGIPFQPWVGVVDRVLAGDCDCADQSDFCVHSAAVVLAALEADVKFAAEGRPHGVDSVEPEPATFVEAVGRLGPQQLTDLVVEQATRDRLFATRLLSGAGMLTPLDEAALDGFDAVLQEASAATAGVEYAGQSLVAEVEILLARPAEPAMLDLVEQAIEVWDELAGHLIDADEISEPLVAAYQDLCRLLDLDPEDIADRLTGLLDRCPNNVVDAGAFTDLLGEHSGRVGRAAAL